MAYFDAVGNTVRLVAKFYSHEWAKVRQGRTDKAIKTASDYKVYIRSKEDRRILKTGYIRIVLHPIAG
jgi:hypothetical protein